LFVSLKSKEVEFEKYISMMLACVERCYGKVVTSTLTCLLPWLQTLLHNNAVTTEKLTLSVLRFPYVQVGK
jgi:hypothetical protein